MFDFGHFPEPICQVGRRPIPNSFASISMSESDCEPTANALRSSRSFSKLENFKAAIALHLAYAFGLRPTARPNDAGNDRRREQSHWNVLDLLDAA